MSNQSKTFCILPHTALAIQNKGDICACNKNNYSYQLDDTIYTINQGSIDPIWENKNKLEIINALDNGIQHFSCKGCWDEESAGKPSSRQLYNTKFKNIVPLQNQPRILILKPGNTCNAACRICNPETSSSWYSDAFNLKKKKNNNLQFSEFIAQFESIRQSFNPNNPNFWPSVRKWMPGLQFIDIYGGEPMLIKGLWEVLEYAVKNDYSKHIELQLHTNLSIFNKDYLDILSKFKTVKIGLSIDSNIATHFEYMRHKLNYQNCIQNAQSIKKWADNFSNVNLMITCSVSVLNVYYLDETIESLSKHFNLPVSLNFVTKPDVYYDIRHLPKQIKNHLITKYSKNFYCNTVVNFLKQNISGCVIHWPQFCMITDRLDTIRNQNFKITMPEWHELLQPYWDYKKSRPEWF